MEAKTISRTFAERFADFAVGLRYEDLPLCVVKKVKMHFLDSLGVALACPRLDYAAILTDVLFGLGGKPQASVIGRRRKVPAPMAAFANGSMIHGIDFDDSHMSAVIHGSAFIVPLVLAIGEERRSAGRDVIAAAVAGYEVVFRMGMAAPQKFHKRGFHPTLLLGSFASALAAGKLMGLDANRLSNAMGIAGSLHGAGLQEFLNDGTWSKRLHPGWASFCGTIAALLAERGYTGPHRILEGKYGLFNSYLGAHQFDAHVLVAGLGDRWETMNMMYKFYPSCHATHIFMESAVHLKEHYNIEPDCIAEIHARVSELDETLVVGNDPVKYRPPTTYAARFSLPYCLGVVLSRDQVGMSDFGEEAIKNEKILSLSEKVTWSVDRTLASSEMSGYVAIKTKDNKLYEHTARGLRGSREMPVEDGVIENKFRLNADATCSRSRQEKIIESVLSIDDAGSVEALMKTLRF